MKQLGILESTQEARLALGYASSNFLRIFRALQTSRVLHISMNARWHMNQLLCVILLNFGNNFGSHSACLEDKCGRRTAFAMIAAALCKGEQRLHIKQQLVYSESRNTRIFPSKCIRIITLIYWGETRRDEITKTRKTERQNLELQ